jgi:hypothetical protein
MYYYVITIACSIIAMYYFCLVEEVFPFPWGIIPILKGLAFERLHMEGSIIFIDNRMKLSALRLSCPLQHHLWFRVATRILEALSAQIYSTGKDRLFF